MILLKKKQQVENFIDVEKEQEQEKDIQYTEDDVSFYNEYLGDDNIIFNMKHNKFSFYMALISLLLIFINTLLNVNRDQYVMVLYGLMVVMLSALFVMYFKVKKMIEQFKALGNVSFNFHYFVRQKIIKKIENNKKILNKEVLDKIIKLYPEKEQISIYYEKNNTNVHKTIESIYDQYLSLLEHNKIA